LRGRRLNGFKCVRQEKIGAYHVDFVCRDDKLVVEADGATHSTVEERDHERRRETFLIEHGFRVLRVSNADVCENLAGVCETSLNALEQPRSSPSPRIARRETGVRPDALWGRGNRPALPSDF
jgi:very-short-patch-repair endonuclease